MMGFNEADDIAARIIQRRDKSEWNDLKLKISAKAKKLKCINNDSSKRWLFM